MMSEFERGAMIEFINLTLLLFIVVLSSSFFLKKFYLIV